MAGGCVFIDDAADGGSNAGAWLTHIAHTPALRAQCPENFPGARPSGRTEQTRAAGEPAPLHAGPGSPASIVDTS